jgi:hypothetical protein
MTWASEFYSFEIREEMRLVLPDRPTHEIYGISLFTNALI